MAYRGELPDDIPEDGALAVTRESPMAPDQLLRHLESIGIDLDGFDRLLDQDPMLEHPSQMRYPPRRRRMQA